MVGHSATNAYNEWAWLWVGQWVGTVEEWLDITPPYTCTSFQRYYMKHVFILLIWDFSFREACLQFSRSMPVFTIDRFHCTETLTVQSSKLGVKYYFVSSRLDWNTHMKHWTLNSSHHSIQPVELHCLNGRVLLICGNVCIPLTSELWPTPHAVLTVFRTHLAACSPHLYTVKRSCDSALWSDWSRQISGTGS